MPTESSGNAGNLGNAVTPGIDLDCLWRNKGLLALSAIVGFALGTGYVLIATPTYQAQARVLVERRGLTPATDATGRVDPEFLPTQAEMIRSPVTLARALKSVQITMPASKDPAKFDPVKHVMASLQVTPVLKANVLTVSYQSIAPDEALGVVSAVIESFQTEVNESDRGTWATNVEVMAAREQTLRADLDGLQKEYAELRNRSPLIGQGRDATDVALSKLNELGGQLSEAQRRRIELETRLGAVKSVVLASANASPSRPTSDTDPDLTRVVTYKPSVEATDGDLLQQVVRYSEIPEIRSFDGLLENMRFAKLRVEELDATYGPKHPELVTAKAEYVELENLLRQRLRSTVTTWEGEVESLKATERRLQEAFGEEKRLAKEVDVYLVQELALDGKIRKIEQLHSTTLGQLQEIQSADKAIAEGRSSIEVRVLDGPALLDEMVWPKRKETVAASTFMGLAIAVGLIWMRNSKKTAAGEPS